MARFRVQKAFSTAQERFYAGQVVTDTIPLTVVSDRYWSGLSAATLPSGLIPLDASATSMKNASAWAGEVLPATILGVDSIS